MKVHFEDEYGNVLKIKIASTVINIPTTNDVVIIDSEEFLVKSRTFHLDLEIVVVNITQTVPKIIAGHKQPDSRLNEAKTAIIGLTKRQDVLEKKEIHLNEQISNFKRQIDKITRQQQKKDQNDQT